MALNARMSERDNPTALGLVFWYNGRYVPGKDIGGRHGLHPWGDQWRVRFPGQTCRGDGHVGRHQRNTASISIFAWPSLS
jgi:hypothetical protein